MDVGPIGPCTNTTASVHVLILILGALNMALATWLVNRRLSADRRDSGKIPVVRAGDYEQGQRPDDDAGFRNGPPGIQP